MRTIKFRGQRLDNNEWVYGCIGYGFNQSIQYIMPKMYFATRDFGEVDENDNMIIEDEIAIGGFIPVKPETVGQFTGLQDKNGVGIYENDIISGYMPNDFENKRNQLIRWYKSSISDKFNIGFVSHLVNIEVIGNKFDNPELLTKN